MSRKNLNRRHLNFLARQRMARARRFHETTQALRRRTRDRVEARRLKASVTDKQSAATAQSDRPAEQFEPRAPLHFNTPILPDSQATRRTAAALSPAPLPFAPPSSAPKTPTLASRTKNSALRQEISEKLRQFLMTLSLKRENNRDADYIAVWNQALPGLDLTAERLSAYRRAPPDKEGLIEAILTNQTAEKADSR